MSTQSYESYRDTIFKAKLSVKNILSSPNINPTNKSVQLKKLESTEYRELIKDLADKKDPESIKLLVIVLEDLGILSTRLAEFSSVINDKMKHYTDAAVFYHYVLTIINETIDKDHSDESYAQKREVLYEGLGKIKQAIVTVAIEDTGGLDDQSHVDEFTAQTKAEVAEYRLILTESRKVAKIKSETIEEYRSAITLDAADDVKKEVQDLYINSAANLFKEIQGTLREFLAKLYNDAEKEIGAAPCPYTVIGLGSLALSQATPYSDLEFAILTANEEYKSSSYLHVREYFKNLSHLVNFKMISLGETIIPTSRYGVDMSHLVHRGVNFDLGGKTPLGRIEEDKPYELIKTVERMLHYVYNKDDRASHIDKNLPYILENACYVYGNEKLLQDYTLSVTTFQNSKASQPTANQKDIDDAPFLNREIRALKLFKEGSIEINYNQTTSRPRTVSSNGDLEKLSPIATLNENTLFDVKQEIYRLPDRFLYNLSLYYGVYGNSAWDILDKLQEANVINEEATHNLKLSVTFATMLRLRTYLHHERQNDDMSLFVSSVPTETEREKTAEIFHLSVEDLGENGPLFEYFYTALPLYQRLEAFCTTHDTLSTEARQNFFKERAFYSDNATNKGLIYYRLSQYQKAQNHFEEAFSSIESKDELDLSNSPYIIHIRTVLGNIYAKSGKSDLAITQFFHCLAIIQRLEEIVPSMLIGADIFISGKANCFGNIAFAYATKADYDNVILYANSALEMLKTIHGENPTPDTARTLINLGRAYGYKGNFLFAMKYLYESLEMTKLIYNNQPHPDVSDSLNSLGIIYNSMGMYEKAILCHIENLEIVRRLCKDEPHPLTASVLSNLANACNYSKNYFDAIKYASKSLEMQQVLYRELPHPHLAGVLHILGMSYHSLGQHDTALEYYMKSLEMRKKVYGAISHTDLATSLNNIGLVYFDQKKYEEAIDYLSQSLEMEREINKNQPHADIANVLGIIGTVIIFKCRDYKMTEDYALGINYIEESLEMLKTLYPGGQHQKIVKTTSLLNKTYICVALDYEREQKYEDAISCYKSQLELFKYTHKDVCHFDFARILHNLASSYCETKNYTEAIKYFREALHILCFSDNSSADGEEVIRTIEDIASIFAIFYSLDKESITAKISSFMKQHLDFTDYQIHYGIAVSLQYGEAFKYNEVIEEYKLALIFIQENSEEGEVEKIGIYDNLSALGVTREALESEIGAIHLTV